MILTVAAHSRRADWQGKRRPPNRPHRQLRKKLEVISGHCSWCLRLADFLFLSTSETWDLELKPTSSAQNTPSIPDGLSRYFFRDTGIYLSNTFISITIFLSGPLMSRYEILISRAAVLCIHGLKYNTASQDDRPWRCLYSTKGTDYICPCRLQRFVPFMSLAGNGVFLAV